MQRLAQLKQVANPWPSKVANMKLTVSTAPLLSMPGLWWCEACHLCAMLTKWILAHRVTLCLASARQLKRRAAMTDCVRLYLRANFVAVGRLTWPVTFQSQSTKQCYSCLARESVCVCMLSAHRRPRQASYLQTFPSCFNFILYS